jgi:hypothetical protein
MNESVAKYNTRDTGGKRGVMGGAVHNAAFSTPAYEDKASTLPQVKSKIKGRSRHQTVLMAENVAKYHSRDLDKRPQMHGGAAKGVFSTPAYSENVPQKGTRLVYSIA